MTPLLSVVGGPTFDADGPRIALVGDVRDVVDALDAAPREGLDARVLGAPLPSRRVGVARRGAPVFADLSPVEHVAWAARLAGSSAADARARARRACEAAGIAGARTCSSLEPPRARLLPVVVAVVTDPDVLVCEGLLDDVDRVWAAHLLDALVALVGDKSAVLTVSSIADDGARRDLVLGCDQVYVLDGAAATRWHAPEDPA
ncbi:MAG: hypothetical protein IT374_03960 [Polyangiaceae bacterium]|nr:hypothetical protein [Polyangiaceae bacterium]